MTWGPEAHGGSTSDRLLGEGSEYGTGLIFPAAGCWNVHVSDSAMTGDVYLVVE